ncbi:quinolinate synthase [Methanolinea mesophila]|uniref:quinolinate synthase NadA n=1 Tax=Methanolinea mesophila TaxID=547055 RepID=UPI001AEAEF94|nr:quinolinate synthase NadA [Methanolinea mesophila]MBP1928563.1 quinolinate synthase [Methanolinea mesophila]
MNYREEIRRLKERKSAIILAHNYQPPGIQDMADVVGDSLELAIAAKATDAPVIIFCGVDFMAETAKILNPGRKVLIPVKDATCPLAAQLTPEMILAARNEHPSAAVVLYINSTARCKAYADVICTSANAVKVVSSLDSREVIVGPDANLAAYIQDKVPGKYIIPLPAHGHCYVHQMFTEDDIREARIRGGRIICHPECRPEIQKMSDLVASTGGMVRSAPEAGTWNVFTERDMGYRLRTLYPGKTFYMREDAVCEDMKKISLEDLRDSLEYERFEIILPADIMEKARSAIERMIEIGR